MDENIYNKMKFDRLVIDIILILDSYMLQLRLIF